MGKNQIWEKQKDGKMKLIEEKIVPDIIDLVQEAVERLKLKKGKVLVTTEIPEVLKDILEVILKDYSELID